MWIFSQELDENANRPQLNVIENQQAALLHHLRRVLDHEPTRCGFRTRVSFRTTSRSAELSCVSLRTGARFQEELHVRSVFGPPILRLPKVTYVAVP
jgi:hypothetical protein